MLEGGHICLEIIIVKKIKEYVCMQRETGFNLQVQNRKGRRIQLVLFGKENFGYAISSISCATHL
jgi:hypothetical protein